MTGSCERQRVELPVDVTVTEPLAATPSGRPLTPDANRVGPDEQPLVTAVQPFPPLLSPRRNPQHRSARRRLEVLDSLYTSEELCGVVVSWFHGECLPELAHRLGKSFESVELSIVRLMDIFPFSPLRSQQILSVTQGDSFGIFRFSAVRTYASGRLRRTSICVTVLLTPTLEVRQVSEVLVLRGFPDLCDRLPDAVDQSYPIRFFDMEGRGLSITDILPLMFMGVEKSVTLASGEELWVKLLKEAVGARFASVLFSNALLRSQLNLLAATIELPIQEIEQSFTSRFFGMELEFLRRKLLPCRKRTR